jgi:hypothetical protein
MPLTDAIGFVFFADGDQPFSIHPFLDGQEEEWEKRTRTGCRTVLSVVDQSVASSRTD